MRSIAHNSIEPSESRRRWHFRKLKVGELLARHHRFFTFFGKIYTALLTGNPADNKFSLRTIELNHPFVLVFGVLSRLPGVLAWPFPALPV